MELIWFAIVALMAATWVALDGFALGAGALHLLLARSDRDRRSVLVTIGPFWDGNEVWLLALGGVLFTAFPAVLAVSLSGLYMAVFLIVWCLILRGVSLELRQHVENGTLRNLLDGVFGMSSLLLCMLFGVALGNLLRGFTIGQSGRFSLSLFGDFQPQSASGILDSYTLLIGVFALLALMHHGALWLNLKAIDPIRARAAASARPLWWLNLAAWIAAAAWTQALRPDMLPALLERPFAWVLTGLAVLGFLQSRRAIHAHPGRAFLSSSLWLLALLAATATCSWPTLVHSRLHPAWSLTAFNAASPARTLELGLIWWSLAFPIALLWLSILLRLYRGRLAPHHEAQAAREPR